jgi:hypothetical protein
VATVYGEWEVSPDTRTGRICLVKLNNEGTVIWQKKIGPKMYHCNLRNIRETISGDMIVSGFYYPDTISEFVINGLLYKFTKEGDSIWFRNYYYSTQQYDQNLLYDVYPCQDKGYIAAGFAWPDIPGTNEKLWIIKVDSMGCDTAGCATGTHVYELPVMEKHELVKIYPNPAHEYVIFQLINFFPITMVSRSQILITNSYGQPIAQIPVTGNKTIFDCSHLPSGIYFYQFQTTQRTYSGKFLITR